MSPRRSTSRRHSLKIPRTRCLSWRCHCAATLRIRLHCPLGWTNVLRSFAHSPTSCTFSPVKLLHLQTTGRRWLRALVAVGGRQGRRAVPNCLTADRRIEATPGTRLTKYRLVDPTMVRSSPGTCRVDRAGLLLRSGASCYACPRGRESVRRGGCHPASSVISPAARTPDSSAPFIHPGEVEVWSPAKCTRPSGAARCGRKRRICPRSNQA
jgi:hypothetical protein